MWQDLLRATALMLVLEGVMPFLSPTRTKALYAAAATFDARLLRRFGLAAMLLGAASLQALHWFA